MKRRDFLRLSSIAGSASLLAACGGSSNTSNPAEVAPAKLVLQWNSAILAAIRDAKPGPPMVARSLAIVHTAMYDAWAAYDAIAIGSRLRGALRRPEAERTLIAKSKAISQAAYLAGVNQFPAQKAIFEKLMTQLGYSVSTSFDPALPEGIGNLSAQAVIDFRRGDGANQDGSLAASGLPYADYTGYSPMNPATSFSGSTSLAGIPAPDHWQPLSFNDAAGVTRTPGFIAPHWRNVVPFAMSSSSQFRPGPPAALNTPAYRAQAQQIVDFTANLTEKQKCIAEYWADGPNSELPPGHWNLFAQVVSERDKHDLDKDVRLFFALNNALFDAGIATWECKRFYDYVRPISAIRFLFNADTIKGYGSAGPTAGIVDISGSAWRPFQRETFPTPPFAEYTSGHSAFSAAGAEVLRSFSGSDNFNHSVQIAARSLVADPSLPVTPVTLAWTNFTEASEEAGMSRLYGGIHFADGNNAGKEIGRKTGAQAYAKAKRYWDGSA